VWHILQTYASFAEVRFDSFLSLPSAEEYGEFDFESPESRAAAREVNSSAKHEAIVNRVFENFD